jgi:hypothetical protein
MPELGLFDDSPVAAFAFRVRRFVVATSLFVAAGLFVVTVTGCGGEDAEQKKALEDAQAAVTRERATLTGMQAEYDRLLGEYQMHEFESRVWMGQVSLGKALGLDLERDLGDEWRNARFFFQKWPWGWFGRIDRLLTLRGDLLPWYNRYKGESYNRRQAEYYKRMLRDLGDRLVIQRDRVRNAEEYVQIIGPRTTKK